MTLILRKGGALYSSVDGEQESHQGPGQGPPTSTWWLFGIHTLMGKVLSLKNSSHRKASGVTRLIRGFQVQWERPSDEPRCCWKMNAVALCFFSHVQVQRCHIRHRGCSTQGTQRERNRRTSSFWLTCVFTWLGPVVQWVKSYECKQLTV